MNEHDSERIAGLLEADGLEETDQRRGRRRRRPQHVLHPGERRQQALRHPRPPEVAEGPQARPADRRRPAAWPRRTATPSPSGRRTSTSCSAPTTCTGPPSCSHEAEAAGRSIVEILEETVADDLDTFPSALPVRREVPWAGWVTIQIGCDNSCAFCIVPGRARQGDQPALRRHRRRGRAARPTTGVTEVTLLGQNVNSYGRDLTLAARQAGGDDRIRPLFDQLLRAVGAVDGIERVRYTSPHPKDLRPETIAAMAETPAVCEHLHLPLQSGSDRVLAAMHRGYTAERYLERLAAARAAIDDLAVTTDIIVGFPGETDDDFERTLEVAAEAAYDSAYTFIYSPRPGTEAAERVDDFVARRRRGRALRAPAHRGRALRPGQARGARRPRRGGPRRGPVPQGPRRPHRPHPPEQARALRVAGPIRPGSYATVRVTGAGAAPPARRPRRGHPAAGPQDAPARCSSGERRPHLAEEPYDSPVAAAFVAALHAEIDERYADDDGRHGPTSERAADDDRVPRRGHAGAGAAAHGRVRGGAARRRARGVRCGEALDDDSRGCSTTSMPTGASARSSACTPRRRARRRGVSRAVLVAPRGAGRPSSATSASSLETGTAQPRRSRCTRAHGWRRITPYGHYRDSPESVCFAKDLVADATTGTGGAHVTEPGARRPRRRHRLREVGARPRARPARPHLGARLGRLDAGVPGHGHRHGQADRRPSGPRCRTTCSTCSTRGRTAPSPGSSSEARDGDRRHRGARPPGAARRRHGALRAGRRRRPRHPRAVPRGARHPRGGPRHRARCTPSSPALDPVAAGRMEPTNRRRIVRALEVTMGSGRPFSSYGPGLDAHPPTAFTLVGLRRAERRPAPAGSPARYARADGRRASSTRCARLRDRPARPLPHRPPGPRLQGAARPPRRRRHPRRGARPGRPPHRPLRPPPVGVVPPRPPHHAGWTPSPEADENLLVDALEAQP